MHRKLALSLHACALASGTAVLDGSLAASSLLDGSTAAKAPNASHGAIAARAIAEMSACSDKPGFPICGVQYVPHIVGDPFPLVADPTNDPYQYVYSHMHNRDLPLIRQLGSNAIRVAPWNNAVTGENQRHQVYSRREFFDAVRKSGIKKIIPTFQLSKHFWDMVQDNMMDPDASQGSFFSDNFLHFVGTLAKSEVGEDVSIVAWSLDLSLDLSDFLSDLAVSSECNSREPENDSYKRYRSLIVALLGWLKSPSFAQLHSVPLLVPMDLTRGDFSPDSLPKARLFMQCFEQWSAAWNNGGLHFGSTPESQVRWFWNIALPLPSVKVEVSNFVKDHFETPMRSLLAGGLTGRMVVMLAAQALAMDENEVLEEFGPHTQQHLLHKAAIGSYNILRENEPLDGIILDEWMDNWDRGSRGPFVLAKNDLDSISEACPDGNRFSHSATRCSRQLQGTAQLSIYPEYFGLASSVSRSFWHCASQRFTDQLFQGENDASKPPNGLFCATINPSKMWLLGGACGILLTAVLNVLLAIRTWCASDTVSEGNSHARLAVSLQSPRSSRPEHASAPARAAEATVPIAPQEPRLRGPHGGHRVKMTSTRFASTEEATVWLQAHCRVQVGILERQVQTEVRAQVVLAENAAMGESSSGGATNPGSGIADGFAGSSNAGAPHIHSERVAVDGSTGGIVRLEESPGSEAVDQAMVVIYRRCLEGFASWCEHVGGRDDSGKPRTDMANYQDAQGAMRQASTLFAEAVLLRVLESLGEAVINCPERLSFLLYGILRQAESNPMPQTVQTTFEVDFDRLQEGLEWMSEHSNPYRFKPVPHRGLQLGINFDDINDSGIQCRREVAKTFKESRSILVLVDYILCYRAPLAIKMWTMSVAFYLYLGNGRGTDWTTRWNGSPLHPQWLRLNFIQYAAILDALLWSAMELTLVAYFVWQRWPSLGKRAPGVPSCSWLLEHISDLVFSVVAAGALLKWKDIRAKPPSCLDSGTGICQDPRDPLKALCYAAPYFLIRVVVFLLLHRRRKPAHIFGTPGGSASRAQGSLAHDALVGITWIAMLAVCCIFETLALFPSTAGLDWGKKCGFSLLVDISQLSETASGRCNQYWLTSDCSSCVVSVSAVWILVLVGGVIDIFFVFYVFSSIGGWLMGNTRRLNDLKHTSQRISFRNGSRDLQLLQDAFGDNWRYVWAAMARSFRDEALVSPTMAHHLANAAGLDVDLSPDTGYSGDTTSRSEIALSELVAAGSVLAAERLAFFLRSLEWISCSVDRGPGPMDARFLPSVSMVIPTYSEMVIPSAEFLRAGSHVADARNQALSDSLGIRVKPPHGDGVHDNLAFIISQFREEWYFLACRLGKDPQELYTEFRDDDRVSVAAHMEVRLWAAMRTQSVAKTVIGALSYQQALYTLPHIRQYYDDRPTKKPCEDHAEVILAHQTYGQRDGDEDNDRAVNFLMEKFSALQFFVVIDLNPGTGDEIRNLVEDFMVVQWGRAYRRGSLKYARCKCDWDKNASRLRVVDVLPRKFPLRLGQKDYQTQGKASNQLNGLFFASGHFVQAMDCNMGAFVGECFKVPHALRLFYGPAGSVVAADRSMVQCRYLGFREFIFTSREGCVGRQHAAAEWTFGTIYQRFLSGLGARMHYGHPDFVDGFWARNRGGMSKCSPVVNLSEDIFAGYNVRMREERSPHTDLLEFEKGRESTLNAASNFFCKIAGGSVAMVRSRDNHLLCENIGIMHAMSFYISSCAFYVTSLLVDISIYLYVFVFVAFSLASIDLGSMKMLGSTLGTEWVMSMGLVSIVPQFMELVLEYGPMRACRDIVFGLFSSCLFFIFQSKTMASSVRAGIWTGVAKYFFTGRPIANQHQTWRDLYLLYWRSHYYPSFTLLTLYLMYQLRESGRGKLPMFLVAITIVVWFVTPIIFSPLPRWDLMKQDFRDFSSWISERTGMQETDLPEVMKRAQKGEYSSLYECTLSYDVSVWTDSSWFAVLAYTFWKVVGLLFVLVMVPAGTLDFAVPFCCLPGLQWLCLLAFLRLRRDNVFLVLSVGAWVLVPICGKWVIGNQALSPNFFARFPEYFMASFAFYYMLGALKCIVMLACRCIRDYRMSRCATVLASSRKVWQKAQNQSSNQCQQELLDRAMDEAEVQWNRAQSDHNKGVEDAEAKLRQSVRYCYFYFFDHHYHMVLAFAVLLLNSFTTSLLMAFEAPCFPIGLHTWWLLNSEVAANKQRGRFSARVPSFIVGPAARG